jgi:hypothetical protein
VLRNRTGAVVLLAACVLSACGGSSEPDGPVPTIGGDPATSTPSETPTPSEAPTTGGDPADADDEGNDVYARDIVAETPDQQAVADAWVAYWTVRSASYGAAEVSPDLGTVATGSAAAEVIDYVAMLASKKWRTEGDLIIDVSSVEVDGDSAQLASCMENGTVDRDASGEPVEPLVPYYDTTAMLVRSDDVWRVSDIDLTTGGTCS